MSFLQTLDSPVLISDKPAPPPHEYEVRQLLDSDPCLCASGQIFGECCRLPYPEGARPEQFIHLLFTMPGLLEGAPRRNVVQRSKLNGTVPPDEVVASIRSRLHSKSIQAGLQRLPSFVPTKKASP